MNISVGSKNPNKVEAVRNIFTKQYKDQQIIVIGIEVSSGIPDQPLSLDVTITGAMNRARNSFVVGESDLSIGIEGGIVAVPQSHSGYMQCEACVIYDGTHEYLGLSGAFALPKDIIKSIVEDGMNLSEAFRHHGHTTEEYIGHKEGVIGSLSKGMINRDKYTETAIQMAMVHYLGKEMFI